jgi:D-glutamate N-acetyltransferase
MNKINDDNRIKAVVLAHDAFGTLKGKTANGVILYEEEGRYNVLAIIDRARAEEDAGDVLGIGTRGIPIVESFEEALKLQPEALILGVAPPGGRLPDEWRENIKSAIRNGMDIINGLHQFLNDDSEFSGLAKEYGVTLVDNRRPPENLVLANGECRDWKVPVVAVLSTDAACGKHVSIMEFMRSARKAGYNPGFVATGQSAMLLQNDAEAVVDAIPIDFAAGEVERLTKQSIEKGRQIVFVEGQGSLSHPAYGPDSMAVLYGCWPAATILIHDPFRPHRAQFPQFQVATPNEEIKLIETLCPDTRVICIVSDGEVYGDYIKKTDDEVHAAEKKIEEETGLPTVDVLRYGADRLFKVLVDSLKERGYAL